MELLWLESYSVSSFILTPMQKFPQLTDYFQNVDNHHASASHSAWLFPLAHVRNLEITNTSVLELILMVFFINVKKTHQYYAYKTTPA